MTAFYFTLTGPPFLESTMETWSKDSLYYWQESNQRDLKNERFSRSVDLKLWCASESLGMSVKI